MANEALSPSQGSRPTALVTGASGGIGASIAAVLAEHGHDLVLVARSRDKLEALGAELTKRHGARATVVTADLGRPEGPEAVAKAVKAAGLTVDVLVNNAGLGSHGRFDQVPAATDLGLIALNVTSLTHLTKLFLPGMVERRRGRVLNVASTAAFVPGPFMSVYYASKAYVLSLSFALSNEMAGTGVTVTCLCPGPTKTAFEATAGTEKTKLFQGGGVMEAEPVARAGVEAMMEGRAIAVPGFKNWVLASTSGLLPRAMLAKVARSLQDPGA